jgi:hypothetical protein
MNSQKLLSKPPLVLTAAEHGPYWRKHVHSFPEPREENNLRYHKFIIVDEKEFHLEREVIYAKADLKTHASLEV